jgi:hypothetical protein
MALEEGLAMAASAIADNFDPRYLPRTPEPRVTRESDVSEEIIRFEKLAAKLECDWADLPDGIKVILADWAYEVLDDIQPPRTFVEKAGRATMTIVAITRLVLQGRTNEFYRWLMARDSLVNAVLDGIEMDRGDYRADLREALQELNPNQDGYNPSDGTWITGDNALEQLNELSRNALKEV